LGGLWALEWASFGRFVGVRVGVSLGGLWALEWAWPSTETNLRCVRNKNKYLEIFKI